MSDAPTNITQLLLSWSSGRDKDALDQITPLVYRELRKLADSYLRRERGDHTLQPSTKPTCAWWTRACPSGAAARTSSASRRN